MADPMTPGGLLGRQAERDRLQTMLDRVARTGRGSIGLISGPAGIGKSSLARWLLERASERGFGTVEGGSNPLNRDLPYGPFVQALGRSLRALDQPDRDELVSGLPSLASLLPGLTSGGADARVDSGLGKTQLFESVLRVLDRMSRRVPLVMVVDDAQWCDAASLELIAYLSRDLPGLPMLLVLCYRPGDDDARLSMLLHALHRTQVAEDVEVPPLGERELGELVERLLGGPVSPALQGLLADRSGGIPLFARELVAAVRDQGVLSKGPDGWRLAEGGSVPMPPVARQAILDRLSLLGQPERALAELVAVAGGELPLLVATEVAGPGSLTSAMGLLIDKGLLVESAHPEAGIRLDHPLAVEVVHDQVPPATRRTHHRRLAEAWAHLEPRNLDRRVFHCLRALPDVDAGSTLDLLDQAARAAGERHAHQEAASHLLTAVSLARSVCPGGLVDLLVRLGVAHLWAGDLRSALEAWDEALDELDGADDPTAVLPLHCLIADACADWGDLARASRHVRAGLDLLSPDQCSGHEIDLRRAAFHVAYQQANPAELDRAARELELAAGRVGGERAVAAVAEARGVELLVRGSYDAALRLLAPVMHDLGGSDPRVEVREHSLPAIIAAALGDLGGLRERNRRAGEAARRIGVPQAGHRSYMLVFLEAFYSGDWARADEVVQEAERLAETFDHPRILTVAPTAGAVLAGFRGDFGEADRCLGDLRRASARGGLPDGLARRLHAIVSAVVELERGDPSAAWSGLEVIEADYVGDLLPGWAVVVRAEAQVRTGRIDESLVTAARLSRLGPAGSYPDAMGARIRGLAAAASGRWADAVATLAACAEDLAALGMPFEEARVGIEAAELARSAHLGLGVDPGRLAAWRSTAVDLGARRYAARAGSLVERLPGAPPPAPVAPRLTPRQVEVAEAVAEGLSNAEIAERLFVSVRTVESHLDHIYTRLGIGSRVSLATYVVQARARAATFT